MLYDIMIVPDQFMVPIMRLLLILSCLATPAFSQVPDVQTLEEPDRIWLRDTLHPAAELGVTIPFLPHVRFHDGMFQDRMAAYAYVIAPDTCADPFQCEAAVNDATMYDGKYDLTETGLALTDMTRSPLIFDRADVALALQSDSFSRGERDVPLTIVHGALWRPTPAGNVRYVPANTDDIDKILALAIAFEVSIAQNYNCLVAGHLARKAAENPDTLSQALLALSELGAIQIAREDQKRALLRGHTVMAFDLPPQEQAAYEKLNYQDIAFRLGSFELRESYSTARDADDDAPLPSVPAIKDIVPDTILDRFDPSTLAADLAALEQQLALWRLALPAVYHLENITPDRNKPSDLLCHAAIRTVP